MPSLAAWWRALPGAGARRVGRARPAAPADARRPGSISRFVDGIVERIGRGSEAAIPILQAIQEHYRYLPDEALRRVCELTEITPAQIAGTSTFYAQFRHSPVGRARHPRLPRHRLPRDGRGQIRDELRRHLGIPPDRDTDRAGSSRSTRWPASAAARSRRSC